MFQKKFLKGCMLVTGGAKSGKSRIALDFCNSLDKNRVFLATAQAFDREMTERIRRHKEERGSGWSTIEEPLNVAEAISSVDNKDTVILFDCFTLWLNNLYMKHKKDHDAAVNKINNLLALLTNVQGMIVVVSNEVGMGIVPDNELSRRYRDDAGSANQRIARISEKVIAVIAGLPLVLKDV